MRVLHVVASADRRGAETFAADLVTVLNHTGVEQSVAVLKQARELPVSFQAPVEVLGDGGWRVPGLRMEIGAVRNLKSLIRRYRPDVIQAHGGDTLKYSVVCADPQVPVVYRSIGLAPPWVLRGARAAVYRGLLRKAARIVAVAETIRRQAMDVFGVSAHRVVHIPNGIDARRMRASRPGHVVRGELGLGPTDRVVLSLGALTWEKDPPGQLSVMARVLEAQRDVVHLMVGDGPMRRELQEVIRARALENRIRVLGVRDDVANILSITDVLLVASKIEGMEGMPGCVIEAGMMGIPTAGYAVAGLPEIVEHGVSGLLATPGDAESLARSVLSLLRDAGARSALGNAAQQKYRAAYDIRAIAPRYLDVYEAVG